MSQQAFKAVYPAPQQHYIHMRFLGELIFGSLHDVHVPLESKLLPAVLLLLRIYFPQITVTITVLKFGWINLIAITVTVLASAVTPSFPLVPNYHLESHLN